MRIPPGLIFLTVSSSLLIARAFGAELTVKPPIRFHLEKDHRTWLPEYPVTNGPVSYIEWVLKEDSINCWKELFDERTIKTDDSIRKHLDTWRALLIRVDPKAQVTEEKNADDGITVTYTSLAGDEMGISTQVLKIWRDIISAATLAPEHAGKKD